MAKTHVVNLWSLLRYI